MLVAYFHGRPKPYTNGLAFSRGGLIQSLINGKLRLVSGRRNFKGISG